MIPKINSLSTSSLCQNDLWCGMTKPRIGYVFQEPNEMYGLEALKRDMKNYGESNNV